MGRTIRLGSARGISINLHPTFALMLLWVIYQWGIATDGGLRGVAFGTAILLAVFACVLLHELAHAFVAMRYGLRVRDITLLPIGGVARVEHAIMSPRAETVIALAGPLANLAIAAALTPIVALVIAARHIDLPVGLMLYADELSFFGFILYLWIANLLLTVFNLIPAFPMDGGRVLRAALSTVVDRLQATRLAVAAGQVIALLLALAGLWIGDYLLPVVSLFILVTAWMEARVVEVESSLRRMTVGQFALWESGGVRPDVPLAHAVGGGPKDIAVTQDGRVVGMLWRHDLLRHLNGAHHDLYVRDIMDRRFHPVDVDDAVYDVQVWLTSTNRPAVPVVEGGAYRGIFTLERLIHVHQHIDYRSTRWQRTGRAILQRLRLVAR